VVADLLSCAFPFLQLACFSALDLIQHFFFCLRAHFGSFPNVLLRRRRETQFTYIAQSVASFAPQACVCSFELITLRRSPFFSRPDSRVVELRDSH
jgi:hypothetical protein